MSPISYQDYIHVLEPWIKASEEQIHPCADRPEMAYYGTGYNTWGVQTHQKALAAFAVLAAEESVDESRTGMPKERILDYALKMLRFTLQSHIEGDYACNDGSKWGHTWISVLGIERMMHAVGAIDGHLTAEERQLLRKVLISESDWLMDHYEIVGHPYERSQNKPESNLWNGALLHRTAAMYPDAPRAKEYIEKGNRFLVNAISVPSDAQCSRIVDGRPVSEWHVGANYFESYALNHHQYLNVGYMVICLSNAAMLHFMYKEKGLTPPESLYHHVPDLWKLVKACVYPDGRLLRIGGDTRVRYAYCQEYMIPVYLMMAEHYGDEDCEAMEAGWLGLVRQEMEASGDGTYMSARLRELDDYSPLYYTRLESDRAVCLAMGAYWRKVLDIKPNREAAQDTAPLDSWQDEYHGANLERGRKRIASWVWEAAESPQGLCLPADDSSMAEWRENLSGRLGGYGELTTPEIVERSQAAFNGGFLTAGTVHMHSERFIAEGQSHEVFARKHVVFAALPDETTVLVMQHAETLMAHTLLAEVKGLYLQIPNDLFNGNRRSYYTERGLRQIGGVGSGEELLDLDSGWLNIDDRLGVVGAWGGGGLQLYRPGRRQIGIKKRAHNHNAPVGMLYADEICYPCAFKVTSTRKGEVLYDLGAVLQAGVGHASTRAYASAGKCGRADDGARETVRALAAEGADGRGYLLIANRGERAEEARITLPQGGAAVNLQTGERVSAERAGRFVFPLRAREAQLYRID